MSIPRWQPVCNCCVTISGVELWLRARPPYSAEIRGLDNIAPHLRFPTGPDSLLLAHRSSLLCTWRPVLCPLRLFQHTRAWANRLPWLCLLAPASQDRLVACHASAVTLTHPEAARLTSPRQNIPDCSIMFL